MSSVINERVTWMTQHICLEPVLHESRHTYMIHITHEQIISQINESCLIQVLLRTRPEPVLGESYHTRMSPVTCETSRTNGAAHVYRTCSLYIIPHMSGSWSKPCFLWVMSHTNESCHICISHVTDEWVMPHMNVSCHIYEWVMSHIWMSHVT